MAVKPDIPVPIDSAQAIIDKAIPGERVVGVSKLHGGEIAAIYEIAFASGRAPVVLKAYPQSLYWKMRKEANMLALVHGKLRVPAPSVLLVDETKLILDLNFLLMTKLDGSVLGSIEKALPAAHYLSAYKQIGALLHDFHRIPMPAFGYIGADGIVTPHASNRAYLSTQFERKLAEFVQRGGEPLHAQQIARFAEDRAALLDGCKTAVLCHNDLHAGNVLARVAADDTVTLCGVLDFENTQAADPLMDIAKAAYYLKPEERSALFEGYGDTGRPHAQETLRTYHLYFVLVLWCWMAEIGNAAALPDLTRDLERAMA